MSRVYSYICLSRLETQHLAVGVEDLWDQLCPCVAPTVVGSSPLHVAAIRRGAPTQEPGSGSPRLSAALSDYQ